MKSPGWEFHWSTGIRGRYHIAIYEYVWVRGVESGGGGEEGRRPPPPQYEKWGGGGEIMFRPPNNCTYLYQYFEWVVVSEIIRHLIKKWSTHSLK